jgi:hypothetical protein
MGTSHSADIIDVTKWARAEAERSGLSLLTVVESLAERWGPDKRPDRRGVLQWVPLRWLARNPTEWGAPEPSQSALRLTPEQDRASIEDLMRAGGAA